MKGTRCPKRASGGFTMVELMTAVTLILIAVAGTLSSQITIGRLAQTSEETRLAAADLRAAMEELLLLPLDDIPVAGSPFEAGAPIVGYEGLNLTNERITGAYPGYSPGLPVPDPLTITLTMTWRDHQGRARSMSLSSMKTR